ncbi:MAG: hypothetical protein QXO25_04060 [Candidatus Bathyarchaeia archaeon]
MNVMTVLTAIFFTTTIMQGYLNYALNIQNHELTQQNQRLQSMMFDYTPEIFAYAREPFDINLKYESGFGRLKLVVVVITPHNGYVTVNQTSFSRDVSGETLARENIQVAALKMEDRTVLAISQGSNEKSVEIPFRVDVKVGMDYIRPGRRDIIHVGDVRLQITYHDIQAGRQYSREVSVPVRIVCEY